jgi:hypothetical protein
MYVYVEIIEVRRVIQFCQSPNLTRCDGCQKQSIDSAEVSILSRHE